MNEFYSINKLPSTDRGGGGGQKIRKFCGRNKWMAPNEFFEVKKRSNARGELWRRQTMREIGIKVAQLEEEGRNEMKKRQAI